MAKKASATLFSWDKLPEEQVNPQLSRKLISGERTMLAHIYIKKGAIVPKHHHENEQFTYVITGALHFYIGDDPRTEVTVRTGEVLHLPSNLPHEAHALEDTLDMDVFTPPRADWLNKTDTYLRKK